MIDAVSSADSNGERVDLSVSDKLDGLFKFGVAGVSLSDGNIVFGARESADFGFDADTTRTSISDDSTGGSDIVSIRK